MEDSRFFISVWRFNAIILMVAGILSIGLLIFSGYHIIKDVTRKRNTRNIVNVSEDQQINEKWELGRVHEIVGTPYALIPLTSDQSYAQSYYSKSSNSARNYLFIDTENSNKQWLFDTNEFLVADIDFLSEKEYKDDDRVVRAILYTVIEEDTNGDKRLTGKDEMTIALSMPSGHEYKRVLTGIDTYIGHQVMDKKRMFLVYQKEGIGYTANLSFSDFSISNISELPKIKNSP